MERLLASLTLLLLAAACGEDARVDVPANGIIRLSDEFTGAFALTGHDGAAYANDAFNGKIGLVYFGFASCPDVCPAALGVMSAALNELSDRELADLQPLFITVDPERDTPEALRARLSHDPRILGLTGPNDAIEAAKKSFKVYAEKEDLPGSALGYTVNHLSLFYVTDRDGRPVVALRDTLTPQQLAAVLRDYIRA